MLTHCEDIMTKTRELIDEAISLPVEIRTKIIEELFRSLNPLQKNVEELWAQEAEKRVEEIQTGKVKKIPGDVVFHKLQDKFSS